jgi:hypothetical protein
MSIITQFKLSHAESPSGWCIRSGDDGGLKLTFSKVVLSTGITDEKKSFRGITSTKLMSKPPMYRGTISQGVEVQILEWTIYQDMLYVSDGTTVYKLLMSKSHGKRSDTQQGVVRRLRQSSKIAHIML